MGNIALLRFLRALCVAALAWSSAVAQDPCSFCTGNGEIACPECDGTGVRTIECSTCQGRGRANCSSCTDSAGTEDVPKGHIDCTNHYCHDGMVKWRGGTSFLRTSSKLSDTDPCLLCKKVGDFLCPRCSGKSSVPCAKCAGSGKHKAACGMCGGQGRLSCPLCKVAPSTTTCIACSEAGSFACSVCAREASSSARCTRCDGKGKDWCRSCSGLGKRACAKCGGTGKMRYEAAGQLGPSGTSG